MKRFLATLSVLTLVVGAVTPVWAENSLGFRIAQKVFRGFENTAFGFVTEWPKTIYYDSVDHGIPYGVTVGALRGVGMGVLRTGVGVYEVATFPVPMPGNYTPLLYPEYPHQLTEETR
ncbi:MAG: exosortase system-associated protein, TIGR04073 family [Candidatus Rokubacteria bacterium]|nr:exosortase system-associated protein, TIGR04073 family [Candidatus Rokubacteria bacterium]